MTTDYWGDDEEDEIPRELISSSHHGVDNQTRDAVSYLTDAQLVDFLKAFPAWPRLIEASAHPTLSSFDTEAAELDVEYPCWVIDWIEENTAMFWEDGDLWETRP